MKVTVEGDRVSVFGVDGAREEYEIGSPEAFRF